VTGPRIVGSEDRAYVAPVLVARSLFGYLVMHADSRTSIDEEIAVDAVQHAATLCALAVVRQRGRVELSNGVRRDLITGLLIKRGTSEADASRLLEISGLVSGTNCRVLCAEVGNERADVNGRETQTPLVLETLAAEIGSRSPKSVTAISEMGLTSLIPDAPTGSGGASAGAVAKDSVARVRALFPAIQVVAGLGRGHSAPRGLPESFSEARNALLVRRRLAPSAGLLRYEELGVYSILYKVADSSELTGFVDRVLGALLAYDRRRQTDLVPTLRAILENNGSVLNAARAVGAHVNTVAYRSQRIRSVSGLDLASSEDRLKAHLALKILDGLSAAQRDCIGGAPASA
jgi:hypothetical protein